MKYSLLAVGAVALQVGGAALGQTSVERFERQLEQIQRETRLRANPEVPAGQRALVDYGAFLTYSFFAIDDVEQNTHLLNQYDLIGYGRLNIDNVHEFFLRARAEYRQFRKGESFDGEDYDDDSTVEQAYYRFDLGRYLSAYKNRVTPNNLAVQVGRQYVYWANGLVLAQYLDGGRLDASVGNLQAQLLGGLTTNEVVDFDASRPNFDDDTDRVFWGAMLSAQLGRHRPFVYALIQRDQNDTGPLTGMGVDDPAGQSPIVTEFEYNSYYLGVGANGAIGDRLVYAAELVYEGGRGLSNSFNPGSGQPVEQEEEEISAGALELRLDYLLADANRTRLSIESILATGDDDRLSTSDTLGGNEPGTKDHAFNAWGVLNTGLAFAAPVSNVVVVRGGASTFPFSTGSLRRLQVGTDLFLYGKFDKEAPIDEPTTVGDRFLGFEPDVYVNWQITSDVVFALRYGVFFPGSAIINDEHPRNFFFASVTFAF